MAVRRIYDASAVSRRYRREENEENGQADGDGREEPAHDVGRRQAAVFITNPATIQHMSALRAIVNRRARCSEWSGSRGSIRSRMARRYMLWYNYAGRRTSE